MEHGELTRRELVAMLGALPAEKAVQAGCGAANAPAAAHPINDAEIELGITPARLDYPCGNALRYGADPTGIRDSTTAIQNAIDAAWLGKVSCRVPGGTYTIGSELVVNRVSASTEYRGHGFGMYGDGSGNVEAIRDQRTTVIRTSSDITLLRYVQYRGRQTNSGNYFIEGIRWQQDSSSCTAPVILLDVLGSFSRWSQCDIYNAGTGDGLRCLEFTQATIERCTIINRDWVAATPWQPGTAYAAGDKVINARQIYVCTQRNVGKPPPNSGFWAVHSRSGTGVNIFAQYNAGLGTIRHVSVRGFQNGIVMGDESGNNTFGMTAEMCDVSNVGNGIVINSNGEGDRVIGCYFEGCETRDIVDKGRNSIVSDNVCLTASRIMVIDGSGAEGGGRYERNDVGMSTEYLDGNRRGVANNIGIAVRASSVLGVTVANNTITWGFSGTGVEGVIGVSIAGSASDPPITYFGNIFNPNSPWRGGAGTRAIADGTNAASGSLGRGAIGFGQQQDDATFFPLMSRGAFGLWRNPRTIGESAVSEGMLTLGAASYYVIAFTRIQTIASLNPAVCSEGHVYVLRFVNREVVLAHGARLKLAGGTNFTPGPDGAIMTLIMDCNVAYEVSRTEY
jgi:hypothetical protein